MSLLAGRAYWWAPSRKQKPRPGRRVYDAASEEHALELAEACKKAGAKNVQRHERYQTVAGIAVWTWYVSADFPVQGPPGTLDGQ